MEYNKNNIITRFVAGEISPKILPLFPNNKFCSKFLLQMLKKNAQNLLIGTVICFSCQFFPRKNATLKSSNSYITDMKHNIITMQNFKGYFSLIKLLYIVSNKF